MKDKKKIIIDVNQKMCDELNRVQDEVFKDLSEETKKMIGVKKYKPRKLEALFG